MITSAGTTCMYGIESRCVSTAVWRFIFSTVKYLSLAEFCVVLCHVMLCQVWFVIYDLCLTSDRIFRGPNVGFPSPIHSSCLKFYKTSIQVPTHGLYLESVRMMIIHGKIAITHPTCRRNEMLRDGWGRDMVWFARMVEGGLFWISEHFHPRTRHVDSGFSRTGRKKNGKEKKDRLRVRRKCGSSNLDSSLPFPAKRIFSSKVR